MKRQEKNEIYSIRKFKIGVGSALIGLSVLSAGLISTIPAIQNSIGIQAVHAAETTPQPEGRVIAQGEDGVPWELYENGYLLFKPVAGKDTLTNGNGVATWKTSHGPQIKHVGFAGKVYAPADSGFLFSRYSSNSKDRNFNPITFDTTNLDTSKVTNMGVMFSGLSKLTNLDVTRFDTSKVDNMYGMFNGVSGLTSLDVTHFDTSKVTNMGEMFKGMSSLTSLDLTHFDTSSATIMYGMFANASKLATLDLSHFNTSNVTNTGFMFSGMGKLTSLDLTNFDTSSIQSVSYMFGSTHSLKRIKLGDKFKADAIREISRINLNKGFTNEWYKSGDENHVYSVDDWAAKYAANPTTSAGTWVLAIADVPDKVEVIQPSTVYEKDATRDKGAENITIQGRDGRKVTPVKKIEDPQTGELVEKLGEPRIEPAVDTIVKVAAKDKVVTEKIASPVRYEKDPTREKDQPDIENKGQDGKSVTTTTYDVNSTNGEITENVGKPVVTSATETVIKVAAKDKVVTEKIASPVRYEKDTTREKDQPNIENKGKEGSRTTTTTYDVDSTNGNITENVGTPVVVEATETVIKVAAKDKVVTENIPSPIRYEKDDTREKDQPNIETKGTSGTSVTTTTYDVNPTTGAVTENVGQPVVTPATETVIKVAAKDKVVEKELPSKVRYVGDASKDNGSEPVRTEGNKGKEVTTTVYTVDPKTGEITEDTSTKRTEEPTDTVVTIGTKPKVERIKQGTKTIERTTDYTVNPETGEVTETVTDKLISELSAEPPVADIPAFDESKIKVTTEEIQPTVRYEKDDTRDKGQEDITTKGEVGQKKITTVPVPDENGAEKDVVTEEIVKPAGETVIKVAAKDKVETIRKNGDTIERTTTYTVNPKTGEITEEVTDKLVASNGDALDIKPPVHEKQDFEGGVTPNEAPIVEKPEFNGGVAPADAPIVEKPEFNWGVVPTDAPVHEVPEFKGSATPNEAPVAEKPEAKIPEEPKTEQNTPAKEQADAGKPTKPQLPNTGSTDNSPAFVAGLLSVTSALGLALTKFRRKEHN